MLTDGCEYRGCVALFDALAENGMAMLKLFKLQLSAHYEVFNHYNDLLVHSRKLGLLIVAEVV